MTREQAEIVLHSIKFILDNAQYSDDVEEALNMAIKELQEPKTAESGSTSCISAENMHNKTTGDCISRQAAIDVIDAILPVEPMKNEYTQGITCGAALAMEYVKQLPSAQPDMSEYSDRLWKAAYERGKREAQPERKKGEWIGNTRHKACTACGQTYCVPDGVDGELDMSTYHYCPNCGADMRGEEEC